MPGAALALDCAIGADVSFLKQAEDGGVAFKDNGQAKPGGIPGPLLQLDTPPACSQSKDGTSFRRGVAPCAGFFGIIPALAGKLR